VAAAVTLVLGHKNKSDETVPADYVS
jgi:hypothetical protein